jgi:excinuclease ABC subunit A
MKQGKGIMMVLERGSAEGRYYSRHLMCPSTGLSYNEPAPHTFSFNSPQGACPVCNGLGEISEVDRDKLIPDARLSIRKGGIAPLGPYKHSVIFQQVEAIAEQFGMDLQTPLEEFPEEAIRAILYGTEEPLRIKGAMGSGGYSMDFEGLANYIIQEQTEATSKKAQNWANQFIRRIRCPECNGARLKKEALQFRIHDKNIAELSSMDLVSLQEWFRDLESHLTEKQRKIATELLKEIRTRIQFLLDVGLYYLSLNLGARNLSGGESQRIRLATQIGSQLVNVLYILDEPSIGLHQRDNHRLIGALRKLRDSGNTVIVVEHDRDMILSADHVIDIGPGAGRLGGEIVARGTPDEIMASGSLTAQYLSGARRIEVPKTRRPGSGKFLRLYGASGNNLRNVDLTIPLGMFVCITGVSGSGKSSLINETLLPILSQRLHRSLQEPLPYRLIEGIEHCDKVIQVDQSPIGKTPRSNPATYTGVFSDIRELFSMTPEARIRAYPAGRFSFNVKGGRCEACSGAGVQTIEMNFLPNVYVTCPECDGHRYNRETLEVRYKGKNIGEVLDMTINVAVEFFENQPQILPRLKALQEVGLGYVRLGQPSTTLSGGESQRVKLATELAKKDTGNTVYIMDEPTTGLHFEDIRVLMKVLQKLSDRGNTVVVIEHNLDVVKMADHIIELGPEGGVDGGQIVWSGTPEEMARTEAGHTGPFLRKELER